MIRYALTFIACAGGIALVACSSDDASERFPSSDSFCDAKAEEECNAVAAACGATKDKCKSARVSACNALAGAATGQGRTYKSGRAEACINKTREVLSDRTVQAEKEKEQLEICDRVFTGSKKSGETCSTPTDCEGDLTCSNQVCYEKVEKSQGQPCANPGDTCAKGSYCGAQGSSRFCLAKNDVDANCSADAPCKEELRCVNFCRARLNAGDPCSSADDCSTGFCDTGTNKCAAKSFAAGTAACKDFGG